MDPIMRSAVRQAPLPRRDDEEGSSDVQESWGKLLTKIGVPSAIACFLVWKLMNGVESAVMETKTKLDAHMVATVPLVVGQQQLVNLAVQQCVSAAKADRVARDACFAALVRPPQQ
jgi:hypothetical protein